MKVYTTFILSASITRGVTYAKLTHTVAEGRYTTAPYLFPAAGDPEVVHTFLSLDPQNRSPRTMDFGRNIIELELIWHPNG